MRKKLALAVLTGLLAASLTGCMPSAAPSSAAGAAAQTEKQGQPSETGGKEGTSEESEGEATIRMNWWGGDSRHEATLKGIHAFEELHPNIHVEPEYEAYSGHQEKIALALNSKVAADVLQMNMNWIFDYSPKGDTFLDLNTVSDVLDLTAYEQSDLDFYTINGSLQAVPISKTGRVFFWNKTTFDKIGVPIPSTLDELVEAGKKFSEYENGSYYPLVILENEKIYMMMYFLECKYGKPWVDDMELQYSREELIDGFEFMKMLEDNHVLPSSEKMAGDGADLIDTNQNWIDGHYAGIYMWDSNLQKHQEALEDGECIIGPMLEMGDYHGGLLKISQCLAIPATTKHPKEAAMLIEYLFGSEEGARFLGDSRGVPCNAKGLAALDLSDSLAAKANEHVMDWGGYMMDIVFSNSVLSSDDGIFLLTIQSQSYGQMSAEQCADMVIDGVNQAIESLK
ncbi:ABC transporter substrate-binding protein [Enterocloster citroniae]|uniref:Oligogalacturonide transport system substrate-binding protein n=2 Tax=Enterocloster citroniae TaxID=358743 RepID=A0ABV2G4N9_9FIRM|nr:ABC transporter substrate-binding protein [Enterocloster citroniae]